MRSGNEEDGAAEADASGAIHSLSLSKSFSWKKRRQERGKQKRNALHAGKSSVRRPVDPVLARLPPQLLVQRLDRLQQILHQTFVPRRLDPSRRRQQPSCQLLECLRHLTHLLVHTFGYKVAVEGEPDNVRAGLSKGRKEARRGELDAVLGAKIAEVTRR